MAMNLVRTGAAAGVGLVSGVLSAPQQAPLTIGTTKISWGAIVEGVALAGGAGLQLLAPFTIPAVAEGLVDGGAALLASRGAIWARGKITPAPAAPYREAGLATRISADALAAARGQIGSGARVPKVRIS